MTIAPASCGTCRAATRRGRVCDGVVEHGPRQKGLGSTKQRLTSIRGFFADIQNEKFREHGFIPAISLGHPDSAAAPRTTAAESFLESAHLDTA